MKSLGRRASTGLLVVMAKETGLASDDLRDVGSLGAGTGVMDLQGRETSIARDAARSRRHMSLLVTRTSFAVKLVPAMASRQGGT